MVGHQRHIRGIIGHQQSSRCRGRFRGADSQGRRWRHHRRVLVLDCPGPSAATDRRNRHPYETVKPRYSIGCGGPQASEYAKTLLPKGVSVTVVTDPHGDAHDRYGRTVAAIILADGRNYAIEAARAGHAHAYIYNHRPSIWAPQIASAETEAKTAGRGIWGAPCFGNTASEPLR